MNTVLLIDDEPLMGRLVAMCLNAETTRVVCAATLGETVRAAHAEPPQVILLDLELGDEDEARASGIEGSIAKPFDAADLRRTVEALL